MRKISPQILRQKRKIQTEEQHPIPKAPLTPLLNFKFTYLTLPRSSSYRYFLCISVSGGTVPEARREVAKFIIEVESSVGGDPDSGVPAADFKLVESSVGGDPDSGVPAADFMLMESSVGGDTDSGVPAADFMLMESSVGGDPDSGVPAADFKLVESSVGGDTDSGVPAADFKLVESSVGGDTDSGAYLPQILC